MHATLVVLIDREREEQNHNDIAESNMLIQAYTVRLVRRILKDELCFV
jgi:hypothetical protein